MPEGDLFRLLFERSAIIWASLVHRAAHRAFEVGGIAPEFEDVCDYQLFVAIASRFPVLAVQDVCCWYRVHDDSTSRLHADRIQEEILRLVQRWAPRLDPRLVARRRAVHSTLLGLVEFGSPGRRLDGVRRVLRDGSLGYLLTRPFVRTVRRVRRALEARALDRLRPAVPRNWRRWSCDGLPLTGPVVRRARRDGALSPRANPPGSGRDRERPHARPRSMHPYQACAGETLDAADAAADADAPAARVQPSSVAACRSDGWSCTTHTPAQLRRRGRTVALGAPPGPGRIVNCSTPHIYNLAKADPVLRERLQTAVVTGADGLGIVWAARLLGHRLEQRRDM
ncbi:MAG: hypothetical protein R3F34_04490 [Planctomycetota bacterium]